MKKLFTLIAAVCMAASVSAQTTLDYELDCSTLDHYSWSGIPESVITEWNVDGAVKITNPEATPNWWDLQYWLIDGITLEENLDYTITITCKAEGDEDANLRVAIGGWGNNPVQNVKVPVGGDYTEVSLTVTATQENNGLFFQHGDFVGTLYLKNIKITHEGQAEEETGNHVLRLMHNEAEGNNWDVQSFIKLSGVESGVANTVKLKIMSTSDFKLGTEAIDQFSEHKSEWGATAVFAYTNEIEVTSKWQEVTIYFPGSTDVECHAHCTPGEDFNNHKDGDTKHCTAEETNVEYAASHLQLNWGKLPKDAECYIDDVVVYNAAGEAVSTVDFEESKVVSDNYSADVTSVGWQASRGSAKIIVMEVPEIETAISNVAVESAKTAKALKNGQIVITRGAKAYNAVGQEL